MELKNTTTAESLAPSKRKNEHGKKRKFEKPLSIFELEIITLIYEEKTTTEIGLILGKSPRTIEGARSKIIKKIGCRGIVGIVKYAIKKKIV